MPSVGLKSFTRLPWARGGCELALAADRILLVDDGSAAVSLPGAPLLAVLPGAGGLTRLVDERKVRRERADFFCTTEEGVKGKRAVQGGWRTTSRQAGNSRRRWRSTRLRSPHPRRAERRGRASR